MAISKVVYKSSANAAPVTWMDLTADTVASSNLLSPNTAHGADGQGVSGSVGSGTEGTPTATKGAVSNHSINVTPSVTNTAGVISGGTHTGTAVTVTASELESGTKSITQNGTGIDVTGYSAVDVAVPSGGSNKAFQIDNSNHRVSTTTYTNTEAYLKVTKAGKYDIYWSAFRSSTSSGTNGTQWYKNGVAQGSAYTTWSNSYCQNPHVSGVTLAANDEIEIYARASSTSRYCCVENLMIIEVD